MQKKMKPRVKIIQISNIAPQATKDQISSLFSYIGKIEDIRLYPIVRDVAIPVQSRICFIKFQDRECVYVAQHITNTVFIDRALAVIPFSSNEIPDEKISMDILHSNGAIPGFATDSKWPTHITNHVCIEGSILRTEDPQMALNGLPDYPNLPANTESHKVNEMRRSVVIDNINPKVTTADLMALGETVGEVKYVKLGDEKYGTRNGIVEFAEMNFIYPAMKLHDTEFMGYKLIVNHATTAIVKPLVKTTEDAQAEIEEAMKRVKDVQTSLFNSNMDPLAFLDATVKDKYSLSRSRSRSRSRRKTRSKSRSHRSRRKSRSRSRKRSRSRSRSKRHRSSRKRSGSRSKPTRRRSRSRSKSDRHRKEKESKSKAEPTPSKPEPTISNIDAIAELIGKEIQKEMDSSKKDSSHTNSSSKKEKEEKSTKESKIRRSASRSRSRDRHRRGRSRRRSKSKTSSRRRSSSRSRSKRSTSRSRRKRSKDRRSPRRRSRSHSKKRNSRSQGDRSSDKKERKKEKPEPKKVARNYDEEDAMYSEEKKAEMESKKEEAVDMDISD